MISHCDPVCGCRSFQQVAARQHLSPWGGAYTTFFTHPRQSSQHVVAVVYFPPQPFIIRLDPVLVKPWIYFVTQLLLWRRFQKNNYFRPSIIQLCLPPFASVLAVADALAGNSTAVQIGRHRYTKNAFELPKRNHPRTPWHPCLHAVSILLYCRSCFMCGKNNQPRSFDWGGKTAGPFHATPPPHLSSPLLKQRNGVDIFLHRTTTAFTF